MKKIFKILILITIFFKYDYVQAATELTCIYEGGNLSFATMLVQESDGTLKVYLNTTNIKKPDMNDENWLYIEPSSEESIKYFWDTNLFNGTNISDCPSYTRYTKSGNKYKFYFYDNKTLHYDYSFYKKYEYLPPDNNYNQYFDGDYSEEINNNNWIGICHYENVSLYFNRAKFILIPQENASIYTFNSELLSGFTLNKLLLYYDNYKSCPTYLYRKFIINHVYYLTEENNSIKEKVLPNSQINKETEEEKIEEITSCQDLFSETFLEKLNSYMKILRICVPLLLIVLGMLDFAKSILSSSEDEMKKNTKRFTKRLIAAIAFFLIPTLVTLVLEIANNIWTFIDPNTCL